MRKSLWIVLAVMVVAVSAPNAHADGVTLVVSGNLSPLGSVSCPSSGCTLGGDIVINNTTGAIISEDVTLSGESPTIGPFTVQTSISSPGTGLTDLTIEDAGGNYELILELSTPTGGSLIGYDGGALDPDGTGVGGLIVKANLDLTTGALTPAATAPEPSSVALMLLGVGLAFVLRKRNSRGHQLAT